MRLIDSDSLEPDTCWDEYDDGFTAYSRFQIEDSPTIDAEPVRHGRWIPYFSDEAYNVTNVFICSECEKSARFIMAYHECEYDFCPHCGARMDATDTNVGCKGVDDNA